MVSAMEIEIDQLSYCSNCTEWVSLLETEFLAEHKEWTYVGGMFFGKMDYAECPYSGRKLSELRKPDHHWTTKLFGQAITEDMVRQFDVELSPLELVKPHRIKPLDQEFFGDYEVVLPVVGIARSTQTPTLVFLGELSESERMTVTWENLPLLLLT